MGKRRMQRHEINVSNLSVQTLSVRLRSLRRATTTVFCFSVCLFFSPSQHSFFHPSPYLDTFPPGLTRLSFQHLPLRTGCFRFSETAVFWFLRF